MAKSLATEMAVTLAYGGTGVLLMAVGYLLVDVATPGKLRTLIWVERNRNAAVLLTSNLAGIGIIVTAAIAASANDFRTGILSTLGFGLLGLVLMTVTFVLVDIATPGRLGEILVDPQPHPAVWVTAAVHLAVSAIVAAAIL
jgi:uncharacterized membrane protein YjfL (UPF0719 family)